MSKTVPGAEILVVDDEPALARPLARMLELSGYQVDVAESGEQALDLVEKRRFDLILLDLRLPDLPGLDVLCTIQALAPDTALVILTANASLDSAIAAMRRGALDYLVKPCTVSEIVKRVQKGLERRQVKGC
jgi:DNA-binding response OmpR family regulator